MPPIFQIPPSRTRIKPRNLRHHYGWIAGICGAIAIAALIWLCHGCVPIATQDRMAGFDYQWRGFQEIEGEPFLNYATGEIKVRVVVVAAQTDIGHPRAIGGYIPSQEEIRVVGKMVKGKLVVPEVVIGHEFLHALQFQDGRFANPDEAERNGY